MQGQKVMAVVVVVLACVFVPFASSIPIAGKERIENVLEQLNLLQTNTRLEAVPSVLDPIKEKVQNDITSIRILDDSDRANLVDELASWDRKLQSIDNSTVAYNTSINEHTEKLSQLHVQCDKYDQQLSADKLEVARQSGRVGEQQALVNEQTLKFDESIKAISHDIEMLDMVDKELQSAVEEKAEAAGLEKEPLQNQANSLMSGMRGEMMQTRAKAEAEWAATQQRLQAEFVPIQEALANATAKQEQSQAAVEKCLVEVNTTETHIAAMQQKIVELASERSMIESARAAVEPNFDVRHQARVKRISFLTNMLEQIDQLSKEVLASSTTPTPAPPSPPSL